MVLLCTSADIGIGVTETSGEVRTYGGWRRKRGLGLFGLGQVEMGVAFVVLAVFFWVLVSFRVILIPMAIVTAIVIASLIRIDGLPLWSIVKQELKLIMSAAQGGGQFVSGYFSNYAQGSGANLPGALAPTRTFEITTDSGSSYGVVYNDALEHATATWRVHPHTPHLADQAQVDTWVASWHQFLASLGYIDQISHVAVTVATATEPGAVVAENLMASRAANAPALAKGLLDELARRETDGTTVSSTYISVTFDTRYGPAGREKNAGTRIEHVTGLIRAMNRDIRTSGLASATLLSVPELSAVTKGAFVPSLRKPLVGALRRGQTGPLQWHISGPGKAESNRFYYRHDNAITTAWTMREAPRGHVTEDVLYNLMAPGTFPKRVTWMWNPTKADDAARILETERTLSEARRLVRDRGLRDETARDEYDRQMTDMAAADEARGAGLGDFTILVTNTIEVSPEITEDQINSLIDQVTVEVESRAKQARMLLRPAFGYHDLVLFSTLPAGINPVKVG